MKTIILGLVFSLTSTSAMAERNFSFDILAGQAEQALVSPVAPAAFNISGDDLSFGLRGGYRFSDHLGAEIAYHDYGGAVQTRVDSALYVIDDESNLTAINLGLVGMFSIGDRLSINARAGIAVWELALRRRDTAFPGQVFRTGTDGEDPYVGIGLAYKISERLSMGVEYAWTDVNHKFIFMSGNSIEGTNDLRNLSFTVGSRF
ncbi:hypothetical protein GCM10008090_31500 [Arenicella chitinivorans]|uniref:Outer membrane protein beta-barrel domain-containing protein n=1 Tax=Arenicella chitinivorans TaxID=1329800 RepID=A0A918S1P5_9GAMM|nr:outer membrane beta-barrel protein [Arenicella chitinivorans]GHA19517.1 hypothetical protein GCM10008090_31500 [Arenicella chitinivorans]